MNDADGYCSPSCLTVDGRCMAIVRAGLEPGMLTLKVKTKGLVQAVMEINVR